MKNKKVKNYQMKICSDCGLPGNCKNPKKCLQMGRSEELYGSEGWQDFHKNHEELSPDTYDDITYSYYLSWFTYLLSKGIDLGTIVIIYPTKWVFFDLIPDAIYYACSIYENHKRASSMMDKPFTPEKERKSKMRSWFSSNVTDPDKTPGSPRDFDYFGKGVPNGEDNNPR